MAKKQYFLIFDTETTIKDTAADFGAVLVDRKGEIYKECAVLITGQFDKLDLFYNKDNPEWGLESAKRRKANYLAMLDNGSRTMASVNAVNRWLDRVRIKYNPTITAYNLQFDLGICAKSGIDVTGFSDRFCLWHAAAGNIVKTRAYKQFALDNHLFGNRTPKGYMTIRTNAEAVAGFVTGNLITEPHTAIEDARDFELPILRHILAKRNWRDNVKPYSYLDWQVRDHYKVK